MEKQKKSVGTTLLVVLLLIVTIAALVLATFAWARYTSNFEGNATANVAKWNVTANVNADKAKWTQTFTHVVENKLAPGTSGYIPVTVNANNTEVCFYYEVFIEQVTGNTPTNLHFYRGIKTGGTDEAPVVEKDETAANIANTQQGVSAVNMKAANTNVKLIDGYLQDGESTNEPASHAERTVTEYIYWEWPYQTGAINTTTGVAEGDEQDTKDGVNAAVTGGETMTLTIRVVATQVDPLTGNTVGNESTIGGTNSSSNVEKNRTNF